MSALALDYQYEWAGELKARGVRVNGLPEEEKANARLIAFKPHRAKLLTPAQALAASAKAWTKARAAGTGSYLPLPPGGEGLTHRVVTKVRTIDETPSRHAMVSPSFTTSSVSNGSSARPRRGAARRYTTMSNKTAEKTKPLSGPQLAEKVLEDAGRPVHRSLIAERTVAADRARKPADRSYKGKTPDQTIAAALEVSNVKGGTFVKVSPGVFGLRSWTAAKLAKAPELPASRAEKSAASAAKASAASVTAASKRAASKRAAKSGAKTPGKASPAKPRKRPGKAPAGIDALAAEHSTLISEGA